MPVAKNFFLIFLKNYLKKKLNFQFLAYNIPRPPLIVHTKFQPYQSRKDQLKFRSQSL